MIDDMPPWRPHPASATYVPIHILERVRDTEAAAPDPCARPREARAEAGVRHELKVFSSAMEYKLKRNDHKGGWEQADFDDLFRRLIGEVEELKAAIDAEDYLCVLMEAADVANYAMMIAWNSLRGVTRGQKADQ